MTEDGRREIGMTYLKQLRLHRWRAIVSRLPVKRNNEG